MLLKFDILEDILHKPSDDEMAQKSLLTITKFNSIHPCGKTQICNYSIATQMPCVFPW